MYTPPMFRSDRAPPSATFHVALDDPLIRLASGQSCWLAVNGADAYVPPHWYVSPDHVAIASVPAGQHNEAAKVIGQQVVVLQPLLDHKSPAPTGAPTA
jgi:hypothetical protein